jgi:hypothetical protein
MPKYAINVIYNGSNIFNGSFDTIPSTADYEIITAFYNSAGSNIFVNNGFAGQNNQFYHTASPKRFSGGGVNITEFPDWGAGTYRWYNLFGTGTIWGLNESGATEATISVNFVISDFVSSSNGSAPTSVTATAISGTSNIQISYGASTGGVPAVSAYYYTLNGGSYTSAGASPFTISGLSAGANYYVVMYAYNASWPTPYVASSPSNTVTTYNTGSAPTSVTASVANSTSIQISYGGSTGGVPAVSAYYYTLNGGSYTSASASPFTISGLSAGGTYSVVMYAYNASWPTQYVASSTSNSVTTYNTGSAPSITSATPSTNSISVSFNLSTGGVPALPTTTPTDGTLQVNGYYYSINAGVTKYNAGISSPITISGLNSNTTYNITLYAYHTSWPTQFSTASNTASATTLAIVITSSYYFASSTDLTSKFPTLLNSSSNNVPNTAYLTNLANPINKCMLYIYGARNAVGFKINGNYS